MSNVVATGQEMVRDQNFFKVRGKSGNFTSSQGTFYGHESSHWSWNWRTSWWWVFKKVDPFWALLLRSYQFMYTALHVSGWKHKLINGCRGSGCERSVESITNYQNSKFVQSLIQWVREVLQLSGKSQGNPETSGCTNLVKVPLWSILLFCMA